MIRILTAAALLVAFPSALAAAPQSAGYVARPAAAPASPAATIIVRERLWRCDATGACRGPSSTSSPAAACALAARQMGALAAFEANGRPFDEAALGRCNARTR